MLLIQRPEIKALDEESENKQRFLISPLEPGFGHTLGNSLRRTLLSAIPGAAITHVLFDNAIHEFDVIEGVIEDVPDVLLNIKDIVVSSESEEPVLLRLDANTPGEVTAAQFVANADVEIHNPELVIATLNGSGCCLEFTMNPSSSLNLSMCSSNSLLYGNASKRCVKSVGFNLLFLLFENAGWPFLPKKLFKFNLIFFAVATKSLPVLSNTSSTCV